jgi:hypothetical protein
VDLKAMEREINKNTIMVNKFIVLIELITRNNYKIFNLKGCGLRTKLSLWHDG